jgi:heme-binding NEAT domain protein
MAEKVISKIKLPTGTNGAQETHVIKDREAADTRITEAEIAALLASYTTNHADHIPGGNS